MFTRGSHIASAASAVFARTGDRLDALVACAGILVAAIGFHLVNFYAFGLNRFLFAWAAAYPALYFCSGLSV